MKIILEAQIENISSKVDKSVSIRIGTQELDPSKAGELFSMRGQLVKVLLSDSNITTLEAELVDSTGLVHEGKKNKTPSQRLRAVLYRINEANGGDEESFKTFYEAEMNRVIEHYKAKLD